MSTVAGRGRGLTIVAIVLSAFIWGCVGGVVGGYWISSRCRAPQAPPPVRVAAQPGTAATLRVETSSDAIVQAVKRAGPAVVKVVATATVERYNLFDFFFGQKPMVQEVPWLGSGFIFETEGRKLVLTNRHVIRGADKLTVKLADGRQFPAKVLGADPETDIAALELPGAPPDLPTVSLGDSDLCEVGEWVIAMGNPFDFEHTVTVGVISAKGYRRVGDRDSRYVLQTDAAINSGNSGGPLLDLAGNVIGINFAIYSPTKTNLGIGFAIPINQAKEMMYFLVNGGPWLGFEQGLTPNSPGFARYFGLPTDRGVVILRLVSGSPAANAGLQPGDIILGIDGQALPAKHAVETLRKEILKHKIGDRLRLTIQRGEQVREFEVTAGRIPAGYY